MEQRAWLTTSDRLYPNLYTVLVGAPGVGKTRTIMKGAAFLRELEGLVMGPTDVTKASLVDVVAAAKRRFVHHIDHSVDEFNSVALVFDEWGILLSNFENEIIPILTSFYDAVPYGQYRRTGDVRIKIPRPQLSILAGCTPSALYHSIPDYAWSQGFTSRLVMAYSTHREVRDDFDQTVVFSPANLLHDLKAIFTLRGEFEVTPEYREAVNAWRRRDEEPKPTHPKLEHYNARRRAHIYKLSMIASLDEGDGMTLLARHFAMALGWLEEVEKPMPEVFAAGSFSADARTMDEIEDFVKRHGCPVTEGKITRFAADRLPAYAVGNVLELMRLTGRLVQQSDKPVTYLVPDVPQ